MKFVNLSSEEFDKYISNYEFVDFLQSPKMDDMESKKGWKTEYVGLKENDIILCATKLMSRNTRLKKKYYYAPRGFIIDYNNYDLLKKFVLEIKKYIKKNNGYVLHIDPDIIHVERDDEGNIVEGGIDNTKIINDLKKIGFKHEGFSTKYDLNKQMRWVFVKNLDEDIMKSMKPNTRNLINKAIKYGLKVRNFDYDELYLFKNVTESTSIRRNFKDKSLEYYQDMYKAFKDEIKFLGCFLNISEYKNNLEKELEKEVLKCEKLKPDSGKKKEALVTINGLKKRIEEANKMYDKHGEEIILSVAMFVCFSKEVFYYFSGSIDEYMNFNAQYLIQYEMLKFAKENNYKKYNFLGIKGNFDPKDEDYGVYKFKKGFGGHVEEYIGDFDLPINVFYYINKIIKGVRK